MQANPGRGDSVVVGMSGGVDSSVAAALLVEQGYQVIGITMNLAGSESRCRSLENADDARRVADRLGIHFQVANYKDQFREEVIEPFADAYLSGRTPIPCAVCNERFKFRRLLEEGRVLGARAVATGHYARIDTDASTGERRLRRGRDSHKDQSYFLFRLGPEQLRHTLFPLGDLTKSEVREKARSLGLADRRRSPRARRSASLPTPITRGSWRRSERAGCRARARSSIAKARYWADMRACIASRWASDGGWG